MSGLDLHIARDFKAPPHLIWRAWMDGELLEQWWAPKPLTTKLVAFDPRPGGALRFVMTAPDGTEHAGDCTFLELVEGRRVVFTDALTEGWRPSKGPFITAFFDITPKGAGSHYAGRVLHKDEADLKRHEEMGFHTGWGAALAQLDEVACALAR